MRASRRIRRALAIAEAFESGASDYRTDARAAYRHHRRYRKWYHLGQHYQRAQLSPHTRIG